MQFEMFSEPPKPERVAEVLEYTEHAVGDPVGLRGYLGRRVGRIVTFLVPAAQYERYSQAQRDEMLERFKQTISTE